LQDGIRVVDRHPDMPYFERNFRDPDLLANPEAGLQVRPERLNSTFQLNASSFSFNSGNTNGTGRWKAPT
jgi:hypothetical protein